MRLPPPSFGLFAARRVERDWPAILCAAGLAFLLLLVIAGLGPLSIDKSIKSTGDGNVVRQAIYIVIFGYVLAVANVAKRPGLLASVPTTMVIALLWCALSLVWALSPDIAMRRLLLTAMIIWTIFVAVRRVGAERALDNVFAVLLITLVLNYLAVAFLPSAVHQVADVVDPELVGDWRGILPQKNFTGAICAYTAIMALFARLGLRWPARTAVILASLFFLYKTGSKTSMGLLAMSLLIGGAFALYNPKYRLLLPPLIALVIGAIIYSGQFWFSDFMAVFDNRAGFTGRVEIWATLTEYVKDHWLLGAGFGSFWNIGPDGPIFDYASNWVTKIGAGHNGYLDLLTQIGVPGLVLVVIATVIDPIARLLASTTIDRARGGMLMAMLIFCLGHNVTESSIMDRDQIVQVFLVLVLALIDASTRPKDIGHAGGHWWVSPGPWLARRAAASDYDKGAAQ